MCYVVWMFVYFHILVLFIVRKIKQTLTQKGLKIFQKYLSLADDWYMYDNSGTEYKLVAKSIAGQAEKISALK